MKTIFSTLAAVFVMALLLVGSATAQKRADDSGKPSKNGMAMQKIGDTDVHVTYGRPQVKGRTVFGELEPFGKVWRAGANEATTVTFSTDVKVNGEDLAAGTYAYFIIPQKEGEWTVIFNKEANQWGAFNHDKSKDALRVMAAPEKADHQEELLIAFEDVSDTEGTLYLHWAMTKVPVTITVK